MNGRNLNWLFILVLLCLVPKMYATDNPGTCSSGCTFTMSISNIRNYIISVTWTGSGGSSGSGVVTGLGKTQSASMGPGQYTIHAQYLDDSGTAKNPAALPCGTQIKYSIVSHDGNCAAYNEASVTITQNRMQGTILTTNQPACSPQIINTSDCYVSYDREKAIVPPNIQVSKNTAVTVFVNKIRPAEKITIEAQPVTLVAGPEPFQSIFQAFLPSVTKIVGTQKFIDTGCDAYSSEAAYAKLASLTEKQKEESDQIAAFGSNLIQLNAAIQEPQGPPLKDRSEIPVKSPPYGDTFSDWQTEIVSTLMAASVNPLSEETTATMKDLDELLAKAATDEKAIPSPEKKCYDLALQTARENEAQLKQGFKSITTAQATLVETAQLIQSLPKPQATAYLLTPDPDPRNKFYRKATFAIVSTSRLSKTTTPKTLATITIVYGSSRIEVFSGAVFSTLASRSFQLSPVFVNGIKTNTKVTQTITRPTIIPFASGNYRIKEWPSRWAVFVTGGIGVNPYSTTADFVGGVSVSYRSFVLSPLIDFGRDVRLTQGLYVNELLGPNNSAAPTTERYWRPAFGIGISVRLSNLLGGNSSPGTGGK